MIHYHTRGGLHFLRLGRYRIQWSRTNQAIGQRVVNQIALNAVRRELATSPSPASSPRPTLYHKGLAIPSLPHIKPDQWPFP